MPSHAYRLFDLFCYPFTYASYGDRGALRGGAVDLTGARIWIVVENKTDTDTCMCASRKYRYVVLV